jgi:SEC-C motif
MYPPNLLVGQSLCKIPVARQERCKSMGVRIGKHAPCPCRSGLKFGDCHGQSPEPFTNKLDEIKTDPALRPTWEAMVATGMPFYGVYPSVIIDAKRLRFVRGQVFVRPPDETFQEFVLGLFRSVIGIHWFRKQKELVAEQQHHIFRWFETERDFSRPLRAKALAENKRQFSAEAPGDLSDLLTLAHDVFHLVNAGLFNKWLKKRLLDKKHFQGARYETAVAALATRAGTKVQFVYHPDKKHHDFLAFDKKTQTTLALEAKSRHRAGGLHEPGTPDPNRIKRGDVASLIGQALDQNPSGYPFVVFVDVNVPREPGVAVEDRPWFKDVWADMQSLGQATPDRPDEFSAIFFTNFWHHWAGATLSSGPEYLHIVSFCPRHPIPVDLVGRLMAAVQNYSFVPRQV